ncbi:hypothetical protein RUND412_001062 [Rhizina undulata]
MNSTQSRRSITQSNVSAFSAEADEIDGTDLKQYRPKHGGNKGEGKDEDDYPRSGVDGDRGTSSPSLSSSPTEKHTKNSSDEDDDETARREDEAHATVPAGDVKPAGWLRKFWKAHISVVVPHECARDHLALERTYLAYYRTSLVFAISSVAVSQLMILHHSPHPSSFGFYAIGKPLSVTLACCALITIVLGTLRWWRWQQVLLRGKAISGGWELDVLGVGVLFIIVAMFGLALAVHVIKDYVHVK